MILMGMALPLLYIASTVMLFNNFQQLHHRRHGTRPRRFAAPHRAGHHGHLEKPSKLVTSSWVSTRRGAVSASSFDDLHRVPREHGVPSHQRQLFDLGLGDQKPVERIPMVRLKVAHPLGMAKSDRELQEPRRLDSRFHRADRAEASEPGLDRDLPGGGSGRAAESS